MTVNNAITGIEVDETTDINEYKLDDSIDYSDLEINVSYNYGGTKLTGIGSNGVAVFHHPSTEDVEITDDLDVITKVLATDKVIKFKYAGFEDSITIDVIDYTVSLTARNYREYVVYVDTTPGAKKTTFENLYVTLDYKSGRMDNVTANVEISNNEITEPTTKAVLLSYGGFNETITLKVLDTLESIRVDNIPTGIVQNGEVDLLCGPRDGRAA